MSEVDPGSGESRARRARREQAGEVVWEGELRAGIASVTGVGDLLFLAGALEVHGRRVGR